MKSLLRGFWRRKGYRRLNGKSVRRRRNRVEVVDPTRKKRFWGIKIARKLRFLRIGSPKKFFVMLRDAYVKMMLGFENSAVFSGGYGGSIAGGGVGGFGRAPLKEYDEKMIVEIYKSLVVAQGQLVPRDAGKLGSQVIVYRG